MAKAASEYGQDPTLGVIVQFTDFEGGERVTVVGPFEHATITFESLRVGDSGTEIAMFDGNLWHYDGETYTDADIVAVVPDGDFVQPASFDRSSLPHSPFAGVQWSAADVQTLRPDMSDEDAEAFLADNEKNIQDRMTERGWEAIDTLLDIEDK